MKRQPRPIAGCRGFPPRSITRTSRHGNSSGTNGRIACLELVNSQSSCFSRLCAFKDRVGLKAVNAAIWSPLIRLDSFSPNRNVPTRFSPCLVEDNIFNETKYQNRLDFSPPRVATILCLRFFLTRSVHRRRVSFAPSSKQSSNRVRELSMESAITRRDNREGIVMKGEPVIRNELADVKGNCTSVVRARLGRWSSTSARSRL